MLFILIVLISINISDQSCPFHSPYFTVKPLVYQRDKSTLRVAWDYFVENVSCVDQWRIKYWPCYRNSGDIYWMSDYIDRRSQFYDITLKWPVCTKIQVIAREDYGSFVGVSYHYSKVIEFEPDFKFSKNYQPNKWAIEVFSNNKQAKNEIGMDSAPQFPI